MVFRHIQTELLGGMQGGLGTHQRLVAAHEYNQTAPEIQREQGHGDRRYEAPYDERVPLPLPDFMEQPPGMVAEVLDLAAGHREAAGVKEMYAQFYEWDKQQQVERGYRLGADLGGDLT